jgi:DeoR family glycerol-3-phosphate regulon repressor
LEETAHGKEATPGEELQGEQPGGEASKRGRRPGEVRLDLLRRRIGEDGFVQVAATAAELGVSEMTIRRDLARLEEQQVAVRTHGGAIARNRSRGHAIDLEEPAFDARAWRNAAAKAVIAAVAARIPQFQQTVGLDVGTTALEVARRLDDRAELKIFTNNLRAAMTLSAKPHEVYVPGGRVRAVENSVYGSIAIAQLRQYWLDHVFIGVSGLTEAGCFDYSLEDTEIKRVYAERASNVVVVCDSSKFGRMSLVQVCDLEEIDVLVTDAAPPSGLAEALARANVTVLIADSAN